MDYGTTSLPPIRGKHEYTMVIIFQKNLHSMFPHLRRKKRIRK